MKFPTILLIGAMKAGTTSLYMDLSEHPLVFLAGDKEPHSLCSDEVLTPAGRARYAQNYCNASPDQVIIDASTGYSKRPTHEGVASRASVLLPSDFKVIYVLRHPIERIISQHYHEFSRGEVSANINEAVHTDPRFIQYSRYAYQLEPWINAVGWERIQIVRFEDYVNNPVSILNVLYRFLGIKPNPILTKSGKVYNKSQGKPVRNKFWNKVYNSPVYREVFRPLLPVKTRLAIQKLLLPAAPKRPQNPDYETLVWLKSELAEDIALVEKMLNFDAPLWSDLASV